MKIQEEVLAIQANEGVSRQQAQFIYLNSRNTPNLDFAKAVIGTSTKTQAPKPLFKTIETKRGGTGSPATSSADATPVVDTANSGSSISGKKTMPVYEPLHAINLKITNLHLNIST